MENLKSGFEFIFSSYKRTAAIFFIGALALAIPITITLVGQRQDIRQRAATNSTPGRTPPCYIRQSIINRLRESANNQNSNIQWRRLFGYGDVDLDGYITSKDTDLVLNFDVGSYTLNPLQLEVADVDGAPDFLSGKSDVNVVDALKILRYTNGLEKTFPVCGNLKVTPTCRPRPTCLDTTPRCLIPVTEDMCNKPTPTPIKRYQTTTAPFIPPPTPPSQ